MSYKAKVEWGKKLLGKVMNGVVDSWKRKKIEGKPEQKMSEDKKRRLKSDFIDWKM